MTGHGASGPLELGGRPARRRRRAGLAAAGALAAALVLTACGGGDSPGDVPTRVPATPAAGPQNPPAPAGTVVLRDGDVQALGAAAGAGGGPALLVSQAATPPALAVYDAADPSSPLRTIALPEGAAPLAMGPSGSALVPVPGGLLRADLAAGSASTAPVEGDAISAAPLPGGGAAVGTAEGAVHILDADGHVERTVRGFVSADSLAVAADGTLLVLDAHQTSITEVDPATGDKGASLRVGTGATRIAADPQGRVIALDTDGGQMLVYGTDPLINRQLAPIGDSPAALAVDDARGLVWVTFTGTDEVAAFDLSTGEPVEKHRYPTVAFPTAVAVAADGAVYVGSGSGAGVARIAPEDIR